MTEKKNRNKKQSKAKTSSKVSKGNFGYFRSEKRRRLIMILKCRPMDAGLYQKIHEHQGSLDMAYELYMTFYEKSAYIDAAAVCGNTVVAYSSDPKIDASFMETNSQKIIRKNGYKVTVKIFTDLRPFLERLDSMNDHRESLEEGIKFTPDEKYPDLSRNELIRQTILALCL